MKTKFRSLFFCLVYPLIKKDQELSVIMGTEVCGFYTWTEKSLCGLSLRFCVSNISFSFVRFAHCEVSQMIPVETVLSLLKPEKKFKKYS